MTTCYTCGRRLDYADPAAVVTVPLTKQERAAWYCEQFGGEEQAAMMLAILPHAVRLEAPYVQTYTICRDCIQPVIHARVPSATALKEQFRR